MPFDLFDSFGFAVSGLPCACRPGILAVDVERSCGVCRGGGEFLYLNSYQGHIFIFWWRPCILKRPLASKSSILLLERRPYVLRKHQHNTDESACDSTTMRATQSLAKRISRLSLTTKQTNKGFYKGTGSGSMGEHTKHGGYIIDWNKVRTYVVPPGLKDFKV